MKSLLINPYSRPQEWCKEYFPDRSLGMMPVAGRCAAEYFIDLALRCHAESMLLLGPAYNEHLAYVPAAAVIRRWRALSGFCKCQLVYKSPPKK